MNPKRGVAGFSLIELLVVVALVGLLTGMAFPAIQTGMGKARLTQDLSHLRQIGQGILLYAGENRGNLPPTSCLGESSWIGALRPYLGDQYDGIRISPLDPNREARKSAGGTSYLINDEVDISYDRAGNPRPGLLQNQNLISEGSKRLLLFPASRSKPAGEDHIHSGSMGRWHSLLAEINPDSSGPVSRNRDGGSSAYLFADGHAEILPAKNLKEKVDGGLNIAENPL
ncbi:MAG: prepilin-type N-terminal cleavage/methylation domain-containing protein [Verrucomicrobia bacterium]|nr:prepilin-type N-terminal cleavage/methylation domain-containing protein [Verrucomicrobiota bacterium]